VTESRKISVAISTDQRAGDRVLNVRQLKKSFDTKLLWHDVTVDLQRGDRAGIIGPNGSGKTTLLRVLLGEQQADAGTIRWGANLKMGYYDQRLDDFDPNRSIFEEVAHGRIIKDQDLRNILATMLFRGDDIHKKMGMLSGGERARVALAELLLDKPNVLLLDEPTNHLDINSREALENALAEFDGTILCVSHDRYFLSKIVTRLLVIDPPKVIDFPYGYAAWQEKLQEKLNQRKERPSQAPRTKPSPSQAPRKRAARQADNPYARPFGRLSAEELESQITQTEVAIAQCQQQFGDTASFKDPSHGKELQREYQALSRKLEDLEQEYFRREE